MKLKKNLGAVTLMLAVGCSSIEKATLDSNSPSLASQEIEELREELVSSNVDVIAAEYFREGDEDLMAAKEGINDNEDREEVLGSLATAKAYFLKAQAEAKSKTLLPRQILEARRKALSAMITSSEKLQDKLSDIDNDLRDETDSFTTALSAEEYSTFQKRYLELEGESVQHAALHRFRDIINKAENNDAEDLAPKTLRKAKTDLQVVENLIAQSPRDADQYRDQLDSANRSAKLLQDVMGKLRGPAQGSSESVALKLVYQDRKLGTLANRVENLQYNLSDTRLDAISAKAQIAFQQAMNQVRESVDEDKAIVYQQGNKLIFRIKDINFRVNSDKIPEDSYSLRCEKPQSIISERRFPRSIDQRICYEGPW